MFKIRGELRALQMTVPFPDLKVAVTYHRFREQQPRENTDIKRESDV